MSISHEYLDEVWSSISVNDRTIYDYKRIDEVCIPELCLGLDSEGGRCLILELPHNHSVDFQPFIRKNLALELHKEESIIVLELKDPSFNELFSDLVISLYQVIKDISSVEGYSSNFIRTFHKWSEFFSGRDLGRLSDEDVKGIFGELIVLKKFLLDCSPLEINQYLKSWKGPYDKGKDFELDDKDIEVKTKNQDKLSIKISSEHQLDPFPGKGLELWVISVQERLDRGLALSELILEIKTLIINNMADMSVFRNALWQKGLTIENSSEYDYLKFNPRSLTSYNAAEEGFPAIRGSILDEAINKVRYELNLTLIEEFRIEEISL